MFVESAHVGAMSHIATSTSTSNEPPCHYYGRALAMRKFYSVPMALRIRELREAKGWTQADLAARANMSRSQLAMIERETRPANTLRLNAIAKALGVAPERLFSEGGPEAQIMDLMRSLSEEDRAAIVHLAEALAQKHQR
ncbi:helix-turn-helix domain-containing protein [Dinoroseobacter sp. S375]|uniref:helix-turn-helix domain-containing protein n=1 Tax=Dinoroseobacter sp. S375 TaxID=3415136 RepID=UPI003C7D123F